MDALAARLWAKVDKDGPVPSHRPDLGPCWVWTASTAAGYGQLGGKGGFKLAHRIAYELTHGPIPEGMTLDHLCRVRHCVNPLHLEVVTRVENIMRGEGPTARNARKTHCKHGHEFTPANTIHFTNWNGKPGRQCRTCSYQHSRAYRERRDERRTA